MKRLSGSALAIPNTGFLNVCFILMHVFHTLKRKHISNVTSKITYLAIAWQSIEDITVTFKKFMKIL